eukprot:m.26487 g.26487  ORF g.26487 m.26487 type:complete len:140 (+) comp8831_c0_seq4:18-437(+)
MSTFKRGAKAMAPAEEGQDALDQQEKLYRLQRELSTLRKQERVTSKRSVCQGYWNNSFAIVKIPKGPHFKSMGRHDATVDATRLEPEEALFMVDRGALMLYSGDRLLSFQEVHNTHVHSNIQTHSNSHKLTRQTLNSMK